MCAILFIYKEFEYGFILLNAGEAENTRQFSCFFFPELSPVPVVAWALISLSPHKYFCTPALALSQWQPVESTAFWSFLFRFSACNRQWQTMATCFQLLVTNTCSGLMPGVHFHMMSFQRILADSWWYSLANSFHKELKFGNNGLHTSYSWPQLFQ